MARYHGKHGYMYMSGSGTSDATPRIVTAWTLDMATDKVETTSLQDANKTYVQGLRDISGTFEGMWDDALSDGLFDSAESTDGVKMYLYPSSDAATIYFYGPAWVDMSLSVGVAAAVTFSGTFSANGAWSRKP